MHSLRLQNCLTKGSKGKKLRLELCGYNSNIQFDGFRGKALIYVHPKGTMHSTVAIVFMCQLNLQIASLIYRVDELEDNKSINEYSYFPYGVLITIVSGSHLHSEQVASKIRVDKSCNWPDDASRSLSIGRAHD